MSIRQTFRLTLPLVCMSACLIATAGTNQGPGTADAEFEKRILDNIDPKRLSQWHDEVASFPHLAGTEGDYKVAAFLENAFKGMGLEVEKHAFLAYLPYPVKASLEVLAPDRIELPIKETPRDVYTEREGLSFGWNGYSGSGDVSAGIVYANYGRYEDFQWLREQGIDSRGKIVIARYGGNFRGYKAKFAEAAGAVGLIIYTDPSDSGYGRGLMYPEGGYANGSQIQRGSIKALAYDGDPLTPFIEATPDAKRLDPDDVALPKIPVQPVGWDAARQILKRMSGAEAPQNWQGGLDFRYRLTGGDELKVRIQVEQERKLVTSYNVVGILRGSTFPEQMVIIGSHHDAWEYGAVDPTSGLIAVLEAANSFAQAAKEGMRPKRSIAFAGWGAEEQGIIGSVEWIEGKLEMLKENAVAYINLDAAATGMNFRASSSPALQRVVAAAAAGVPIPGQTHTTVFADWKSRGDHPSQTGFPRFGDLGGGSDHVGFIALAGVPCVNMGASGARGTNYHSNYDNLAWYRQVIGANYHSAQLVTGMAAITAKRLADSLVLPLDAVHHGPETIRLLTEISRLGRENGFFKADQDPVAWELARIQGAAVHYTGKANHVMQRVQSSGPLATEKLIALNKLLMALDRAWMDPEGVPGRPWFQNLYAASDENSGYAPWMLPALRYVVEHQDRTRLNQVEARYLKVFEEMSKILGEMEALL